jgi:hypothetical protein
MTIEKDILQLKEAFRVYIQLKIDKEAEKLMDKGIHSNILDAQYEAEQKYRNVFDALDGRNG